MADYLFLLLNIACCTSSSLFLFIASHFCLSGWVSSSFLVNSRKVTLRKVVVYFYLIIIGDYKVPSVKKEINWWFVLIWSVLPHTRVLLLLNSTRWMERVWSFMCTCRDKAGGLACTHMDVKLKRCTTGVCQLHIKFQTVTVNTTHNYHYYSYNHFSCSALTCRSGWWNLTSSARSTIF